MSRVNRIELWVMIDPIFSPLAVVAGHLCLDIFPDLSALPHARFGEVFQPGRLLLAGPAAFSTGGPVSNTGLALHRLGIPTRLAARLGNDPFGEIVRQLVRSIDSALLQGLAASDSATSYSIVISPPGVDRIFLHAPAANDEFGPQDISEEILALMAGWPVPPVFHFGYPPIMRRMYTQGGQALAEVFRRAKSSRAITSLDMAFPDPDSESGRADWRAILKTVLPLVDIFMPSLDELLFLLRCPPLAAGEPPSSALLDDLGAELLSMGVQVAGLKLGEYGLYLRTAHTAAEWLGSLQPGRRAPLMKPGAAATWAARRLWAPCFQVQVAGTTGAGDATIAGFLSALLRGLPVEQAITAAVAVGACNVEAPDALSGLRSWEDTWLRVRSGWPRCPLHIAAPGWTWEAVNGLWQAVEPPA